MDSNPPSGVGATGAYPFFRVPLLPTIGAEWAALIPLVVHLSSFQDDYRMIGEMTLNRRLNPGLFPKLGRLDSISKLLRDGSAFLDRVNNKSTHNSTVWDVSWGSVFPCANGAARDFLMAQALPHSPATINVEEWTAKNTTLRAKSSSEEGSSDSGPICASINSVEDSVSDPISPAGHDQLPSPKSTGTITKSCFARPQMLHIVHCNPREGVTGTQRRFEWAICSLLIEIGWLFVILSLVIVLCLAGAYGTASIVLSGVTSRIVCHYLQIQRPSGYLQNNEAHDACMLAAIHENASVWVLYKGDRSIVDWILNKTMIAVPQASNAMYYYFRLAHYHQLLAMTYVAAQKGWDGVCLISLMILAWIIRSLLDRTSPAEEWLIKENVDLNIRSFEFTGRTPMIGAVQMLSDSRTICGRAGNIQRNTTWMDCILAPCKRRNSWTDRLLHIATQRNILPDDLSDLDETDQDWVKRTTKLSVEAIKCIESNMVETASAVV